ncbi:MAG: helix-turn-helix domain-containing protein [Candidatus Bathyarchaeota archaeon]|nr:helix-turn-helix domain-containing protein [Candidatus Bathyarchaeota archaeon]
MQEKEAVLQQVEKAFRTAAFVTSERSDVKPSCFDLVTRKGRERLIVKISPSITSIKKNYTTELKIIAQNLQATPLIIACRAERDKLIEDAVYTRHGLQVVTTETLKNVVLHKQYPIIEVKQGGAYIKLDGEAIRKKRKEIGLSLRKAASMIGLSRRTIYAYEKGMAKATVQAALKLEKALGIPAAVQIDPLRKRWEKRHQSSEVERTENRLLNTVLAKFLELGLQAVATKRAPFNFIASDGRKTQIIGGIVEKLEEGTRRRVRITASIAETLKCRSLFITVGEREITEAIAAISCREFLKIDEPEELTL